MLGLEDKYKQLSDEELKAQTGLLKERLEKGETLDDILTDAFAACREAMAWGSPSGCSRCRCRAASCCTRAASPR